MTNKEYIEKNNISFSEAMKMWNNETYPCINDWLNQERIEHKFKVGDFVTCNGVVSGIGVVIDVKDYVYYKFIKRNGTFDKWSMCDYDTKYHRNDHEVFYMHNEDLYEKIF